MAGAIESPLDGSWGLDVRCSECGLEISSRECFPDFTDTPAWLSFGTMLPGQPVQRFLGTLFRMLIPFAAWRSLRMSTGISTRRLLGWWALSILCLLVVALIFGGIMTWKFPSTAWGAYYTWYQMGVDTGMFFRNWTYGSIFPAGFIRSGGQTAQALPTISLISVSGVLLFFFPIGLGYLLLLMLLPVTRKRCNVHSDHLRHVALFSTIPYAMVLFVLPVASLAEFFQRFGYESMMIASGLWLLWFSAWWYGVLRSYLRLPHAFLTVVLMFIFSILFWLTILTMVRSS